MIKLPNRNKHPSEFDGKHRLMGRRCLPRSKLPQFLYPNLSLVHHTQTANSSIWNLNIKKVIPTAFDTPTIMQLKATGKAFILTNELQLTIATDPAFTSLDIAGFLLALLIGYLTSSIRRYQGSPKSGIAMISAICCLNAISSLVFIIAAICILSSMICVLSASLPWYSSPLRLLLRKLMFY
jgi:hypothetical protein